MKLGELGEFEFIDRIAPGSLADHTEHVLCGIGDDAAVLETPHGVELVTTDMLVERVHFLRWRISPRQLGSKAIAVNLSDIAAMGGTPRDALVSIAVPGDVTVEELDEVYAGMKERAHRHGVSLLGGDTTSAARDLCLNVVVLGFAHPDQVLYRSGARVGDRLLVTGTLGDARGGLEILLGRLKLPQSLSDPLLRAHLDPELCLEEARIIASSGGAHAAIDLSDGLSSDLGHICRSSGVGAVLDAATLPISDELRAAAEVLGSDPVALALAGGEDYRLLVAVDPSAVEEVSRRVHEGTGRRLHCIGEIVAASGIRLRGADGALQDVAATGWDHFRPRP